MILSFEKVDSLYLKEADDADPKVESDGRLHYGKGQEKKDLDSASEKPGVTNNNIVSFGM